MTTILTTLNEVGRLALLHDLYEIVHSGNYSTEFSWRLNDAMIEEMCPLTLVLRLNTPAFDFQCGYWVDDSSLQKRNSSCDKPTVWSTYTLAKRVFKTKFTRQFINAIGDGTPQQAIKVIQKEMARLASGTD